MKQLKVTTTASAIVTLDGLDIDEVIERAADWHNSDWHDNPISIITSESINL